MHLYIVNNINPYIPKKLMITEHGLLRLQIQNKKDEEEIPTSNGQ